MADVSLQQALNQQQTLTPQMRRSLEILQSNSMELSQMIHQAMEMNPVLEQLEEAPDESYDEEPDAYEEGDDLGHLNETDDD
jgi:RNA polymerase sigma-54 factor